MIKFISHSAMGIFLIMILSNAAWAQRKKEPIPERYILVGGSANAYRGDLNNDYALWNGGLQLGMRLNHKQRVNGAFVFNYATVSGQAPATNPYLVANNYFKSSLISVNYDLHINFLKTRQWQIYLVQGLGIVRYNPKDEFGNSLQNQINTRAVNESYGNTAIMLPTQVGVNHYLKNKYGLGLQAGFWNTATDYLDNIAQLGRKSGNDNVLSVRLLLLIPIFEKKEVEY